MQTPDDAKYIDLTIEGDDILLDAAGVPVYCWNRDSIGQDLQHAIRESGHLVAMIGERDREVRRLQLQKIRILVEDDTRIVPGTVELTLLTPGFPGNRGNWLLSADTYEFGPVEYNLNAIAGQQ